MGYRKNLQQQYSPLYFLASLGNGGLAVTFFMYLMFGTPHPQTPIPDFASLMAVLTAGHIGMAALVVAGLAGVLYFSVQHVRLLVWNIREYRQFRQTAEYDVLTGSNNAVQLMAIPLTFAMTINVGFILGSLLVPGLWTVVEFLFPAAILGFAITGYFAVKIFFGFFARALADGNFDCSRNNSLGQMLAVFAFVMVAVGFSAAAAMTHSPLTSGIAMLLSLGFLTMGAAFGLVMLVLGFRGMLEHGISREGAASLWIVIPILTLGGITLFRLSMALAHNFGVAVHPAFHFVTMTILVALMLMSGGLGHLVMSRLHYYRVFVAGPVRSPGSWALICPGVALFVFANFFINKGLAGIGLVEPWGLVWALLYLPLIALQVKTIQVMAKLTRHLLHPGTEEGA